MTTKVTPQTPVIEVDERSPMERMPYWARATNPIVRRHLGLYWRTLPPQVSPVIKITAGWMSIDLLSGLVPFLIDMSTTLIVVSIMIVPLIGIYYLRSVVEIAAKSSEAMSDELRNKTMPLLMATPMSLQQILLGKVAASIWRRMDDLMLIIQIASFFGPPLIIMHIAGYFPLAQSGIMGYVFICVYMVVSLLRLVLEPLMIGVVGVSIGAFVPYRSTAMTSAVVVVIFYYLLMVMLHQLNLQELVRSTKAIQSTVGDPSFALAQAEYIKNVVLMVLIEFVVPVVVPIVVTVGTLRFTSHQLHAD